MSKDSINPITIPLDATRSKYFRKNYDEVDIWLTELNTVGLIFRKSTLPDKSFHCTLEKIPAKPFEHPAILLKNNLISSLFGDIVNALEDNDIIYEEQGDGSPHGEYNVFRVTEKIADSLQKVNDSCNSRISNKSILQEPEEDPLTAYRVIPPLVIDDNNYYLLTIIDETLLMYDAAASSWEETMWKTDIGEHYSLKSNLTSKELLKFLKATINGYSEDGIADIDAGDNIEFIQDLGRDMSLYADESIVDDMGQPQSHHVRVKYRFKLEKVKFETKKEYIEVGDLG